jgi:transposase
MEMFSKALKELGEKVLVQWFQGVSRREIAKNIGIGAGTVSEIIKMYKQNDSDFDLEWEYVVNVRKRGLNIDRLRSAIRLDKRLERLT